MSSYYAIFQLDGPVFETGETIELAIHDANEWLETPLDDVEYYVAGRALCGGMYVHECSAEFHKLVQESGGDVHYDVIDGLLQEVI